MHLLACLHLLMNLITIGLLAFALLRGGCLILGHTWCLCMLDSWLILSCVVAWFLAVWWQLDFLFRGYYLILDCVMVSGWFLVVWYLLDCWSCGGCLIVGHMVLCGLVVNAWFLDSWVRGGCFIGCMVSWWMLMILSISTMVAAWFLVTWWLFDSWFLGGWLILGNLFSLWLLDFFDDSWLYGG